MLTATARLLQRQGYHGTGLNQIVAEAGAPKGSMYFHFPGGKEQLAAEAIAASGDYLDAALAAHEAPTALAAVDGFVADVAEQLERTGYTAGCPIATVALEVAPTSPTLGDACAGALGRLIDRLATWIEHDGVDPADARDRAFVVYAAIEGALVFAKASRSTAPLETLRGQLPRLLGVDEAARGPARTARRPPSAHARPDRDGTRDGGPCRSPAPVAQQGQRGEDCRQHSRPHQREHDGVPVGGAEGQRAHGVGHVR